MEDQTLGKTLEIDFGGSKRTIKKLALRKYKELGKAGAELFNVLPEGQSFGDDTKENLQLVLNCLEKGPDALASLIQVATEIPADTVLGEDLETVAALAAQVWKFNSPNLAVKQIKKALRPGQTETKTEKKTS